MKPEKILETLYMIRKEKELSYESLIELNNLIPKLEQEVMDAENKKNGKKDLAKAMNSLLKMCSNDFFNKAFYDKENSNYLCVTDCHSLIRTKENVKIEVKNGNEIDVSSMFKPLETEEYIEIDLPNITDMIYNMKLLKAENKGRKNYHILCNPFGLCCYNVEYFIKVIPAFENYKVLVNKNLKKRRVSPLFIVSDDGNTDAIILPVNVSNDKLEKTSGHKYFTI